MVSVNWSLATMVPTMIVLLWFHFSDKLKQLSSMDQYTRPIFTLIFCRVLPPGISRLSWNCITSYEFFIKCYLPTDSNFSRALSYYTLKNTDSWTESALRFNNSSVSFYKYEFVPDHAIPSLFGYIIVVTILTVLPGPSSRSTIFDDELTLRRSSSSYHFALNNKLGFEFVLYPWFR